MQSLEDQLYDTRAHLAHAHAEADLVGVRELEAQMNTLLARPSTTHEGGDDASS